MKLVSEDSRVHQGHRERMRDKLRTHGARIFDTYELLEMLLYHVVPYRDTNPISKALLDEFDGLDGALSASREELVRVKGIGAVASELIALVGEAPYQIELSRDNCYSVVFDDYDGTGRYITDYFKKNNDTGVLCFLLDGGMRLLGVKHIPAESLSSSAARVKYFLDAAIKASSTVVILASNHRYGPLYPTPYEMTGTRILRDELSVIGVTVAEHFIVSGDGFVGIAGDLSLKLASTTPELEEFLAGREGRNGR